jgi:hypothetical protein
MREELGVSWVSSRKPLRKRSFTRILSRDHHPKMAFAVVRTVAVIERTLLDLLSGAEERMDLARLAESTEAAAVEDAHALQTTSETDPASPR